VWDDLSVASSTWRRLDLYYRDGVFRGCYVAFHTFGLPLCRSWLRRFAVAFTEDASWLQGVLEHHAVAKNVFCRLCSLGLYDFGGFDGEG